MEVTANNIANVNTEGYARQRVATTEIADFAGPGPHSQATNIGNGVQIAIVVEDFRCRHR